MSTSKGGSQSNSSLFLHLESPDLAKRKVAISVLEGVLAHKSQPVPPLHILRSLLHCICSSDTELIQRSVVLLSLIIKRWATFGTQLISENMGLAVMWTFIATYRASESLVKVANDIIDEIQDRSMYAIESSSTTSYFETMNDTGLSWLGDKIYALAQQILTITTPKLPQPIQRVVEKESNTPALMVYFFSFLGDPQSLKAECILPPKLDEVVAHDGIPFMKQQFMGNPNPDAKAAALRGLRSQTMKSPNELTDQFYDELIKCISSPHKILQQEALICTNDFIPDTYHKHIGFDEALTALESGGEEAAMYLERLTRKERQAVLFAKHQNCVPALVRATEREIHNISGFDSSNFLTLMHNIAVTEVGRKSLKENDAVPLLKSIAREAASTHSHHNRLIAAMVLDAMHEDLDEVFNENFVNMTRDHWVDWVPILADLPPHYSARFVQTEEDVTKLFEIIQAKNEDKSPIGALYVLVNTLAHLFTLPTTQKSQALPTIQMIAQHEKIPSVLQQFSKQMLDPNKLVGGLKMVCYAVLSIANNSVRSLVIEEGNIPVVLSLLQNTAVVPLHAECVVQALAVIAFCSASEFVRHGGVDAFLKLLRDDKHKGHALVGLWAVAATDPESAMSANTAEWLECLKHFDDRYARHTILLLAKGNPKAKTTTKKKPKPKTNSDQKYHSIRERVLMFCKTHVSMVLGWNKEAGEKFQDAEDWCAFVQFLVYFVDTYTIETFPESKLLLDGIWSTFTSRNAIASREALATLMLLCKHWSDFEVELEPPTKALLAATHHFCREFVAEGDEAKLNVIFAEFGMYCSALKAQMGGENENTEMASQQEKLIETVKEKMQNILQLEESLAKEEQTITTLKQTVKGLETKTGKMKTKIQELEKTNIEKDAQITQREERCKELEEKLEKPPPNEKLISLARQADVDQFELLNFDKLQTLEEIEVLKARIKAKLKERYTNIKIQQEEKLLKAKDTQIEKLRELVNCPICMDRCKNTIYVPCGHALCSICSAAILGSNSGRCPICRVAVELQHPVYL